MRVVYQNGTQTLQQDTARDDNATDSYYVTASSRLYMGVLRVLPCKSDHYFQTDDSVLPSSYLTWMELDIPRRQVVGEQLTASELIRQSSLGYVCRNAFVPQFWDRRGVQRYSCYRISFTVIEF